MRSIINISIAIIIIIITIINNISCDLYSTNSTNFF